MNFDNVWARMISHAEEMFYTKTGIPFSYRISGHLVILENTNRNIPYSDFETALSLPDLGITKLKKLNLQGPSYIYGILTDKRIIAENSSIEAAYDVEMLACMFENELKRKVQQANEECNYFPVIYIRMIEQYGGVGTAKQLIAKGIKTGCLSDGYKRLCVLNRRDLTMEDSVCKPQYAPLFTEEEIAYCKRLMAALKQ